MMAAELSLLSLSQIHKLKEAQERLQLEVANGTSWMWNSKRQVMADQETDDSWEVRAFEEDTNNAMGTTWPPRSYTCTFCRREFRSAQALGGHMNVHRRDRARLHQTPPLPGAGCTTAVIMNPTHHQELVANGGLCLFYTLPNPNAVLSPSTVNHCIESSSSKLHSSVSPYTTNNFMRPNYPPPLSINFPGAHSVNSSLGHSSNTEHSASTINDNSNEDYLINSKKDSGEFEKEIDLELRLGCGPSVS
ncbi:uncharacterized protein LOC141668083 [Apium graveolens]|uniref:uncharacterized protein LOC141668083 n=1 Tax=Apium graveolens TaxID=4045 RepID=UPI003D7A7C69